MHVKPLGRTYLGRGTHGQQRPAAPDPGALGACRKAEGRSPISGRVWRPASHQRKSLGLREVKKRPKGPQVVSIAARIFSQADLPSKGEPQGRPDWKEDGHPSTSGKDLRSGGLVADLGRTSKLRARTWRTCGLPSHPHPGLRTAPWNQRSPGRHVGGGAVGLGLEKPRTKGEMGWDVPPGEF